MRKIISLSILASMAANAGLVMADNNLSASQLYYGSIRSKYSTNSGLNSNVINPMVSGSSMTTVDSSKNFTVGTFQSSGNPILNVALTPDGSTGDIAKITVTQDLTGDGHYDTYSEYPTALDGTRLISGLCADGYVACPAGTFNSCTYNRWTTTNTGQITTEQIGSIATLSGCYCFNNSCSTYKNYAMLNQDALARTAGGGVVAAFLAAKTGFSISSATAGTGTLTYYGVKTTGVVTGAAATSKATGEVAIVYPDSNPTGVISAYPNTGTIAGAGSSMVDSQLATENSIYNVAINAGGGNGTLRNCTDTRTASVVTETKVQSFNYASSVGCDHYFGVWFQRVSANQYAFQGRCRNPGGGVIFDNYITPVYTLTPPTNSTGDLSLVRIDASSNFAGSGCGGLSGTVLWTPVSGQVWPIGLGEIVCGAPGWQTVGFSFTGNFNYKAQSLQESVNSGCQIMDNDSNCRLKEEKWDSRPKTTNYTPTGFAMGELCKQLYGELRSVTVCRPWWTKTKTYYCTSAAQDYDFSAARTRMAENRNSATLSDSSLMTYSDKGNTYSAQLIAQPADAPCAKVCKTQSAVRETIITGTGAVSEAQTAGASAAAQFKTLYKECVDDGSGNYSCPLDAGESIVQNCTCSNQREFGEAAAALATFKEMTSDTICSATPPGTAATVNPACLTPTTAVTE